MSNPIILRAQAARCFRLAKGAASPRLADELEALGRLFEQEALKLEIMHAGRMPRQQLRPASWSPAPS
jgi:hypothetical protein